MPRLELQMYINAMICYSREYAQALVDAGKKTQDEMSVYLNGTNPGIDWQDEIFRTGITQNYKVAVSSGNDRLSSICPATIWDRLEL